MTVQWQVTTAAIIRSHTISPEMPALATADQAMISRSQASMTNTMRTSSNQKDAHHHLRRKTTAGNLIC